MNSTELKHTPAWRLNEACQNNGPNYWIVSRGWGFPAICQPTEKAYGELIVAALNKAEGRA